ncbi:3-isopropylmalate dehydratase small subunit [soil metagenome]
MTPFTELDGIAAPLPIANLDTDQILPKQFLKTISRSGLGAGLFYDLRFAPDGGTRGDFVLNRAPYDKAKLLIAGENFGCGSSREHAPWALLDFGIRCVIAPSFADIFYGNCFNNGLLPIVLRADAVAALADEARGNSNTFRVSLPAQAVSTASGMEYRFEIAPLLKHKLLNGLDPIGETLAYRDRITAFEEERIERRALV